jgi:hypothetical protein
MLQALRLNIRLVCEFRKEAAQGHAPNGYITSCATAFTNITVALVAREGVNSMRSSTPATDENVLTASPVTRAYRSVRVCHVPAYYVEFRFQPISIAGFLLSSICLTRTVIIKANAIYRPNFWKTWIRSLKEALSFSWPCMLMSQRSCAQAPSRGNQIYLS